MLGSVRLMETILDGLPEDWYVCYYPGRAQPYTLQRRLHYTKDRHYAYETWHFTKTLRLAQAIAERREA